MKLEFPKLRHLHFILLGIFSALFFLSKNIHNFPDEPVLKTILFSALVPLVFYFPLRWQSGNSDQAALISLLFSSVFFGFGHLVNVVVPNLSTTILASAVDNKIQLKIFLPVAFLSLSLWLAAVKVGAKAVKFHGPLSMVLVVLCLFNAFQLSMFTATRPPKPVAKSGHPEPAGTVPAEGKPNIYVIVLDSYARTDVLKNLLDYDNSWFLEKLEKSGFKVATLSTSNYFLTFQSMSAMFNLDYIQDKIKDVPVSSRDFSRFTEIINHPRAMALLRPHHYKYVATSMMLPVLEAKEADVFIENAFNYVSAFENFLSTTILKPFLREHEKYRRFVLSNLHGTAQLGVEHKPALIYTHIMVPHPPFVFDAEGKPVGNDLPLTYLDCDLAIGKIYSPAEYVRRYIGQTHFISNEVLKTISEILEKDTSDPYIILMGDHGSRLHLTRSMGTADDLLSASANLMALRAPRGVVVPEEAMTCPINLMRFVVAQANGTAFEPVPSRVFWVSYREPYIFEEVTDQVRDRFYPPAETGIK